MALTEDRKLSWRLLSVTHGLRGLLKLREAEASNLREMRVQSVVEKLWFVGGKVSRVQIQAAGLGRGQLNQKSFQYFGRGQINEKSFQYFINLWDI